MPVSPTYPGVYIEEVPSGVRTIVGVPTAITAFLGRTRFGPDHEAVVINGFGDFERQFGGLWSKSPMTYAVRDFFLNGGGQAVIVRLFNDGDKPAEHTYTFKAGDLDFAAASPGSWGVGLRVKADSHAASAEEAERYAVPEGSTLWDLEIRDEGTGRLERILNLSRIEASTRYFGPVLEAESSLLRWKGKAVEPGSGGGDGGSGDGGSGGDGGSAGAGSNGGEGGGSSGGAASGDGSGAAPAGDATGEPAAASSATDPVSELEQKVDEANQALLSFLKSKPDAKPEEIQAEKAKVTAAEKAVRDKLKELLGSAKDSLALTIADYEGSESGGQKTGLKALDEIDIFNLLCIPPDTLEGDTLLGVYPIALAYCEKRRAMLLVDPPKAWSTNPSQLRSKPADALETLGLQGRSARNAAVFYPRVLQVDPLREGTVRSFVPCGLVAGVMARTDRERGVWKAPAGVDASLNGVRGLDVVLTDAENGQLNPFGINCLRSLPVTGRVVWGARTLRGADRLADEYKYIPIRRLALYIEESLYRGTQWIVFEPNDEPLWAQIRLNVGAFMHNLFRQGAFQGSDPDQAYRVDCDAETTTQYDIDRGIVNIHVGFAPLKPAEFVIIKIQQIAGQLAT